MVIIYKKSWLVLVLAALLFSQSSARILLAEAPPPVYLSQVSVEVKGTTLAEATAVVTWYTSREAKGRVDYGLDNSYGAYIGSSLPHRLYHEIILAGLKSETTYHFKVSAVTADGAYIESFDQTFKTPKLRDNQIPELDKMQVLHWGASWVVIAWETDKLSDSTVEYSLTEDFAKPKKVRGNKNTTQHEVVVKNLKKGVTYFYRVLSQDSDKNQVLSDIQKFTTAPDDSLDKASLVIDRISPIASPDPLITQNSATIRWRTNRPSKGSVQLSAKKQKTRKAAESGYYQVNHELTVYELVPSTTYTMQIQAKDIFGKSVTVKNLTIRTIPESGLPEPVLDPARCQQDNIYRGYCRDLSAEQTQARDLKNHLDDVFTSRVPLAAFNNWFTLVKAYVYGGYPLEAIVQAVKHGGKTVHPTIPFSTWQNSKDYKSYINK